MDLSTKEKSKQKRKCVNNQNNSELFPVINTNLHHHKIIKNQLRINQEWSYKQVVLPSGVVI